MCEVPDTIMSVSFLFSAGLQFTSSLLHVVTGLLKLLGTLSVLSITLNNLYYIKNYPLHCNYVPQPTKAVLCFGCMSGVWSLPQSLKLQIRNCFKKEWDTKK